MQQYFLLAYITAYINSYERRAYESVDDRNLS